MPRKDKNKRGTSPAEPLKRRLLLLGIVLGLTILSFAPALTDGFTNWDDPGYVLENLSIRDLSGSGVKTIFSSYVEGNYHPLTMLSLAVEYHFFQLNPGVYHVTNVLLHLLNTALVFWFIMLLTGRLETATITALLFGIHPLHVESVAWISERKDVLFSFFYLGALVAYVLSLRPQGDRRRYLAIALILFVLSLFSKGMAVTLPAVFLLVDYYLGKGITVKTIAEKWPFLVLSVAFGVVAVFAQQAKGAIQDITLFPLYERVLFACYGAVEYLVKLVLPPPLSAFYPYPLRAGGQLPLIYYASPVVLLLGGAIVWKSIRHTRDVAFGVLFYLATLVLVLQLLPVGSAIIADRYTYLPYIGIFFLIGQGYYAVARGQAERFRRLKPVLMMLLLGYAGWLFFLTRERCEVWKDNLTLWTDVLKNYPMVPVAYNNRALTYKSAGSFDLAMADYNKALEIKPDDTEAFSNRGNIYLMTGRYDLALADLNKALAVKRDLPVTLNSRGAVYFNLAKYDEALADFNRAIELQPDYPEAYLNRGNALSVKKEYASAIRDYDEYLRFETRQPNPYYWRGLARANTGDAEGALSDFDACLALNPKFPAAYYERSRAYRSRGDYQSALRDAATAGSLGFKVDEAYLAELKAGHAQK